METSLAVRLKPCGPHDSSVRIRKVQGGPADGRLWPHPPLQGTRDIDGVHVMAFDQIAVVTIHAAGHAGLVTVPQAALPTRWPLYPSGGARAGLPGESSHPDRRR